MTLSFDCMDADELAGWLEAAMRYNHGRGNPIPCTDCPMAYHLAMKAEGRCNGEPGDVPPVGEPRRREANAEAARRYRGRRAA